MVEEFNLAEDRKKILKKILKTDPDQRSEDDIKLIEALVEVNINTFVTLSFHKPMLLNTTIP